MLIEIPWVIEEQTKVKHGLLRSYIDPWMSILLSQQKLIRAKEELVYFDGFSGPGLYWETDQKNLTCHGSPIIVGEIANKYLDNNPNRKISIICTDNDIRCVEVLNKKLNEINKHKQNWVAHHAEFEHALNSLLDNMEGQKLNIPPIFFFIDPFGWSGFSIKTLSRILKYKRIELFINFMIYDVIRFCEESQSEKKMEELFGCLDFKKIVECSTPEQKQSFLINLYCNQLKVVGGAKFVMPFRVNTPGQGTRPRYYLVHASNSSKALKVMKDAMAKLSDAPYRFEAIGIASNQLSLFEDPNKISLEQRIRSFFIDNKCSSVNYEDIEDWAYDKTNGVSKTIKEAILKLSKKGILTINRKAKQRHNTVTAGAKISYQGENK